MFEIFFIIYTLVFYILIGGAMMIYLKSKKLNNLLTGIYIFLLGGYFIIFDYVLRRL